MARQQSTIAERMRMVELRVAGLEELSRQEVAEAVGFSLSWVRKWWGRYRQGGAAALAPPPPAPSGPLARFAPVVADAVLTHRRTYPRMGADRARQMLADDPRWQGHALPSARTIHRAWAAAGLVRRAAVREAPPAATGPVAPTTPHAVWQLDHQDGLAVAGLAEPVVLQSVRAPGSGLTIGGDVFAGPRGAHAVPEDAILNAIRRCLARWGRPETIQVDGGVRFLGQSQRMFPSRFELFCRGLGMAVQQTRPGRPTDNGAVERLHQTLDAVLLGPSYPDLAAVQTALDAHVHLLNERLPSRANGCSGQPPLVAQPNARHSGRPYDPATERETFDLAAVDADLARWRWHRQVGPKTGQLSFADRNVRVGRQHGGTTVTLRFDPATREVVIYQLPTSPAADRGPEIRRFHCPNFDLDTILGSTHLPASPAAQAGTAA